MSRDQSIESTSSVSNINTISIYLFVQPDIHSLTVLLISRHPDPPPHTLLFSNQQIFVHFDYSPSPIDVVIRFTDTYGLLKINCSCKGKTTSLPHLICQHSATALEVLKNRAEDILDGDQMIEYLLGQEKITLVTVLLNMVLEVNQLGLIVNGHLERVGLPRDKNMEEIAIPAGFTSKDIKLYNLYEEYMGGQELLRQHGDTVSFH